MDHKTVEEYILSMPGARLDYPFGEDVAIYQVFIPKKPDITHAGEVRGDWKMFALIAEKKTPLRLSLKCDPQLSKVLRERYDEVMEGYHLNKKHWNTIVLSGQLSWEDIQGLIRHSYDLVAEKGKEQPES
jgi:predicted DNA-binding protein (MmcQ/YjbR family)